MHGMRLQLAGILIPRSGPFVSLRTHLPGGRNLFVSDGGCAGMVDCAYCEVELTAPDRCGECGRGQPVGWTGNDATGSADVPPVQARTPGPYQGAVLVLVAGIVARFVGFLIGAAAVDTFSLGGIVAAGFFEMAGNMLLVVAFFLVLLSYVQRRDATA